MYTTNQALNSIFVTAVQFSTYTEHLICTQENAKCSSPVILKLLHASDSLGRLVKTEITGSHLRVSDFVGWVWVPKFCISNKFPDNASAADPEATLGEPVI